uniref:Type III pantothenate kinase n=1 Tax=uncultured Spirochaetales bacterium HF0500_06B09 TaxID=710994 RepID=E0XY80_9SPIR|nr:putative transcriptional regulator, homolog of bvg accessory factor [uncultured Spirochaetales bacterium HF0500_06B09]
MLLCIDIGNTNIVLGTFASDAPSHSAPNATWRLSTRANVQSDEYAVLLRALLDLEGLTENDIDSVAIASSVPPVQGVFATLCRHRLRVEPLIVDVGVKTGVRVRYDSLRDVGADRIVDAAAVYSEYGGPSCVVDFGTGTTFDAIDANGQYLGGAIAPGIEIAADALAERAAKLGQIELVAPPKAIGTNTAHAIQSGLIYGYVGLVEGMVERFRAELGHNLHVVATGGLAKTIAPLTQVIATVDPWITLKGLRLVWQANDGMKTT